MHNNFCSALPITCDPKGTKLGLFKLECRAAKKSDSAKPQKATIASKKIEETELKKAQASASSENIVDETSIKPEETSANQEDEPASEIEAVEDCLNEVNDLLDVSDGDDSLGSIEEMMSKSFSTLRGLSSLEDKMSKSFSSFGRPLAYTSNEAEFTKEEIELRHAEMIQREFSWQIPDWVNSPLKPTHQGKILKANGNLASPVTDIHVLLEKGEIGWEKPEWANMKLRPTPKGEHAKGVSLAEAPTL